MSRSIGGNKRKRGS